MGAKDQINSLIGHLAGIKDAIGKVNLLWDKPWGMIDQDFNVQKLIFRKNGDLLISRNGKVEKGKWELLSQTNSILIEGIEENMLVNLEILRLDILAFKIDGADQRMVLANQNVVPDLDIIGYLSKLFSEEKTQQEEVKKSQQIKQEKRRKRKFYLLDGSKIIFVTTDYYNSPQKGDMIEWQDSEVIESPFFIQEKNGCIYHKDDVITMIKYYQKYNDNNSLKFTLIQILPDKISVGDELYEYEGDMNASEISVFWGARSIVLEDRKIVEVKEQ